jgi:hypothetical protein
LTALNEPVVDRRIERLQGEHGDASVRQRRAELPPERLEGLVEDARDGYVGGAYGASSGNRARASPSTSRCRRPRRGTATGCS